MMVQQRRATGLMMPSVEAWMAQVLSLRLWAVLLRFWVALRKVLIAWVALVWVWVQVEQRVPRW